MVNVAVAGGLGNVGKTIVEALKDDPRHRVIVLSRKIPEGAADSKAPVIAVDYANVDALKAILESNEVHTVVSCLSILDEVAGQAQVNLVKAAAASSLTKRIALSEWGVPYSPDVVQYMPHLKFRLDAVEEAKKTNLQWTRFFNGYFLDYFGLPHIKSYMANVTFALDIPNRAAAIPGTGNEPIVFTYTFDVAKFVQASLNLPEWPEKSIIVGDKISWNEFLKLAEEARGCKFEVHYDDLEKLKTFKVTELPSHSSVYPFYPKEKLQYMFAVFGRWMATGLFDLPIEESLNAKFPDIRTFTVKEMLDQAWKGK